MNWSLARAARACNGRLVGSGDTRIRGVSTDTRSLARGDLFVALRGPNFDAHDFGAEAERAGASALLVERPPDGASAPCVVVPDTLAALADLARARREEFSGPVVAITGSNGKTTTKEMCAGILEAAGRRVHRTPGNLNNNIGLPLSILGLDEDCEVLVVELGMNRAGELRELSAIARPDVAGITNVSAAHLGPVGSLDAIAAAKGEIYSGLREGGMRIVNLDDAHCVAQAPGETPARLGFSCHGREADLNAERIRAQDGGTGFDLSSAQGRVAIHLGVPGRHLVEDAAFAACAAQATELLGPEPLDAIARGLEGFGGVAGRLSSTHTPLGVHLLDDSYNANPRSVSLALETLAGLPAAGRRCAVLADMLELGPEEESLHAACGEAAAGAGIDALLAVGPLSARTAEAARAAGLDCVRHADDADDAAAQLREWLRSGDTVLVKGSRGMRMERLVQHLLENA